MKPTLCLVTPALADANNGNWQTASRWARMLAADYRVRLLARWQGEAGDLMLALHARRSAASIAAWAERHPDRPLVVALTGTDLYQDLPDDADARRSIALAHRLIVLQDQGPAALPPDCRDKAVVCYQSCRARMPLNTPARPLRAVMVGHLRDVKDPRTYWAAAALLADRDDIRLDHIGDALDAGWADEARAVAAACPNFRWLGGLDHATTRRRIQRAQVLVHASTLEGGAHVVMEAVRSGTAVIASRVPGNVGMLGEDHPGCFEAGDAAGLAALLRQCRDEPAMLARLRAAGDRRAALFDPARERETLRTLLRGLCPPPRPHVIDHETHDPARPTP